MNVLVFIIYPTYIIKIHIIFIQTFFICLFLFADFLSNFISYCCIFVLCLCPFLMLPPSLCSFLPNQASRPL